MTHQYKNSSSRWLADHYKDPYVREAQRTGYRSRAVYKLLELQRRYRLFQSGMKVIDLGAAPGSWSQLVASLVQPKGKVFALDILPMIPLHNVSFMQGDIIHLHTLQDFKKRVRVSVPNGTVDWVISDMAPNMSGIASVDQARVLALVERVLIVVMHMLAPRGHCLVKVFQGVDLDCVLQKMSAYFYTVTLCKPQASRKRSNEVYLLAHTLLKKQGVS